MQNAAREKLREKAEAIAKFRELAIEEQEWLFPLLTQGIRNTLELLDLISETPLTYEEIASELGIHPSTVTQKLNALAEGGYPLDLAETTAYAVTGRPRKLARQSQQNLIDKMRKLIEEAETQE